MSTTDDRFMRQGANPIPLDVMRQPSFDVRKGRIEDDIQDIKHSLEHEGQYYPVFLSKREDGTYEILDGNHRYLAAKRLNWPDLDAIVLSEGADPDMAQVVTNLTRISLSNEEKLSVVQWLLRERDLGVTEAADRVGLSRQMVHEYKSIIEGPNEVQSAFARGQVGVRAAAALARVPDRDVIVDILSYANDRGLADQNVMAMAQSAKTRLETGETSEDVELAVGAGNVRRDVQQRQREIQGNAAAPQPPQQGAQPAVNQPEPQQDDSPSETLDDYDGPLCDICGGPRQDDLTLDISLPESLQDQVGLPGFECCAECSTIILGFLGDLQTKRVRDA